MLRMLSVAALGVVSSVATAQGVTVTLSEFKVQLKPDSVRAGRVMFQINNTGSTSHQFHITGQDVDKESAVVARGQAASLTVTLKPGEYELYCPMADGSHKIAGMVAKLRVIGAPPPPAPKKP